MGDSDELDLVKPLATKADGVGAVGLAQQRGGLEQVDLPGAAGDSVAVLHLVQCLLDFCRVESALCEHVHLHECSYASVCLPVLFACALSGHTASPQRS